MGGKAGDLNMADNKPTDEVDVTKEWRATQGQKSAATRLRIFAAIAWVIAISGEIAGVVLLYRHTFDHGNLPLLIGILVGIAVFAIAGSLMWKAANKHDPARESDKAKFFPIGANGAFQVGYAPAEFFPYVNQRGQEKYGMIIADKDRDAWRRPEIYSYPLFICTRPEMLLTAKRA